MKTDNSRSLEEKYQEGYTRRCNELVHANLILIENELFELTDSELSHFKELYAMGKGNDFNAKELRHTALYYVSTECTCLNTITKCYNY
jgi:hypothetical protein